MSKLDVLHTLIDVVSGRKAHLSQEEADAMHEAIEPGSTAEPLTEQEQAQLAALEAKQKAAADQAAAAASVTAPAPDATS